MNARQCRLVKAALLLLSVAAIDNPLLYAQEPDGSQTAAPPAAAPPSSPEGGPPPGAAGLSAESGDANGTAAAFISDVGGRLISGQANGNEVFSVGADGSVVATDYAYDPPLTGRVYVPAVAFVQGTQPPSENDPDRTLVYGLDGYFHFPFDLSLPFPGNPDAQQAFAPVQGIPEGAQITRLACDYYDSGPMDLFIPKAFLNERPAGSPARSTPFSVEMKTLDFDQDVILVAEDTTASGNDIFSNESAWFLHVEWTAPDQGGVLYRFYGCAIEYEVSTVAP